MKKFVLLAMLALALIVVACASPTPEPTKAPVAAPTQAPAAAPTAVPAPAGPTVKGNITLWNGYHTGDNEEKALNQLLDAAKKAFPDAKITVLEIPFDQLFNKFETEAATGGGPDMYIAPNDSLGKEARAGLLAPLDDLLKGKLDPFSKLSVQGVTVDGKIYAVPMIPKALAMYYNKTTVTAPPKTTDELLALVKSGKKVGIPNSGYHTFGWWRAFGGNLMDNTGKCVADQGGVADAYKFLMDLKAAGAQIRADGDLDTLYRQGQLDVYFNGPWVLGGNEDALGKDKVGIAPMPKGPKGDAGPLTGIDGWYINANSKNKESAVNLALYFASKDAQTVYANIAGDPPARTDVAPTNANVKAFADAANAGFPRPQVAQLDNFWGPFGDAATKIFEGKLAPDAAIKEACDSMNKANKIAVAAAPAPTAVPPTAAPKPTEAPKPTVAPTAAAAVPAAPKCEKLASALSPKAGELGAPDKPIVITFVPSVDVGLITKGGTAMADCLTKMTGLTYKIEVGTSETASVEAMGGNKAQFGFLNTFAALLAKEKYDVDVLLVAQRKYGFVKPDKTYASFDFDPDKALAGQLTSYYKPEYFSKTGSGIKTLADIKGKSFCFTTASSTSGGIIPRAVIKAMGIDPDKDMKSSYAGGHDKAAISVYDGTCDAGVAFMDILTDSATNLVGKFPDIQQKVQVFAVGDRIPNDGLQAAKGLDPKIKDITVEALLAMMADPGGNAVIKGIYNYDAFEKADYARYYGPFNDTLKKAGIDVSSLVKK